MISFKNSKSIALAGIIAAIYVCVTLLLYPLSYGGVQIRVSEGLTLLPLLFPESVIGLTVGCLISNFFGNGILDLVLGTLATFLSAVLTYYIGKRVKTDFYKISIGGIFPIVLNALIVPVAILGLTLQPAVYFLTAIQIFIGQFLSVYLVGSPIYFVCKKISNKKRS